MNLHSNKSIMVLFGIAKLISG
uniref:Uncharacterized protein n=1 Tax=Arundo donax TaxID=35708 RepID=A0A0A8Y8Z8_ARUDO